MSLFQQIGDADLSPLSPWIPTGGCLLAAGCAAVMMRPVPGSRGLIPFEAGVWAVVYVAVAFIAAALTGWAAFAAFRPKANIDVTAVVMVFAAAAVWFAPLVIFISQGYSWSIGIAGVVAIGLARLLRRYKRLAIARRPRRLRRAASAMFKSAIRPVPIARRFRMLGAAISGQAGIIAAITGHTAIAAYLIGLTCFLVAWWMAASDRYTPRSLQFHRSGVRVVANVLLAMQLTALGLLPYVRRADARAVADEARAKDPQDVAHAAEDRYSGVILLPEVQRHATIVPPMPALRRQLFHPGTTIPLSVPFSGEYWFFYRPMRRPPDSSLVAHGTPTEFKFTAAGRTPLTMQARQSFGIPIDSRCCSRLELAISNTDPMPGTVNVELILVNTALPERPSLSLGEVTVTSALPAGANENTPAAKEMLTFQMPATPPIGVFDEMMIIFHLREPRSARSANISIDRLYFVPRGS
jgi:hypothetical protein